MSGAPSPLLAASLAGADYLFLVIVVFCVACSSALALAETSLSRISRVKAMAMEDEGRRGSRRLVRLISRPEKFLNSVLLLVLLLQTVAATLLGLVTESFGGWVVAAATIVQVCVVFVLAEAMPKTWAIQHTDRAALRASAYVAPIARFAPLRIVSDLLVGLSNTMLPGKGLPQGPTTSEGEILATTAVAADEGVIEHQERHLIHSIIKFGDTVTREVMVPRPDMVAVDGIASLADVLEIALTAGYSRLPVYEHQIDDVLGLVYLKDIVLAVNQGQAEDSVQDFVRPANIVPETKRVADLLREMQRGKYHMAIVVDEYGGVAGLVTLEDLIEELVGEITDEYDTDEVAVEHLDGGAVRVPASIPVDELNELLASDLPEDEDYESIGGLILSRLGRLPDEGESVVVNGLFLTAEDVEQRRIGRVLVAPRTPEPGADDEEVPAPVIDAP